MEVKDSYWFRIEGQVARFMTIEMSSACLNCQDPYAKPTTTYVPGYILYCEFSLWATGDPDDSRTMSVSYCALCGAASAEVELIQRVEKAIRNRWSDRLDTVDYRTRKAVERQLEALADEQPGF
jgi:hypothetical protein